MNENSVNRGRLSIVILFCTLVLIPSILAWIVNIDVAIVEITKAAGPIFVPAFLYNALEPLCGDLSTVTTFVAVLVFFYPIIHALKFMGADSTNSSRLRALDPDPYPPQFVMFLVLLGLAGTLFGMWIGLRVSGIEGLGAGAQASNVTESIGQLLQGISTAILSSLAGLVGAFIAASPITRIFHWAVGISDDEEELTFLDTLEKLANSVGGGGSASSDLIGGKVGLDGGTSGGTGATGIDGEDGSVVTELKSLTQAIRESNTGASRNREALKKALTVYISGIE